MQTMDEFERQCMNLDVASGVMEDSMASQMAISTPEDEVSNLMQVRVDANALACTYPFSHTVPVLEEAVHIGN